MTPSVLVAGVGNIFFGDDGWGVEVARRMRNEALPRWATVSDFGIRGIHLAYELLDGYQTLVLVDALARGGAPGTLYVFEPSTELPDDVRPDAHSMDPRSVFEYLRAMGAPMPRTLIVGCEPLRTDEEMGLSEPVEGAIDEAIRIIRELLVGRLAPVVGGEKAATVGSR